MVRISHKPRLYMTKYIIIGYTRMILMHTGIIVVLKSMLWYVQHLTGWKSLIDLCVIVMIMHRKVSFERGVWHILERKELDVKHLSSIRWWVMVPITFHFEHKNEIALLRRVLSQCKHQCGAETWCKRQTQWLGHGLRAGLISTLAWRCIVW